MKFLNFGFCLFACFALLTGAHSHIMAGDHPNVLMICVDDLNDWVGFLGGHPQAQTPNMDALAAKGINFTNAHCTAPGCSPSRNALLFGVEPHKSGLYPFYNLNNIEPEELNAYKPLPLLYREHGYHTVGLSKVWHNPDNKYRQQEQWDEYKMYGTGKKDKSLIKEKGYHPEPFNKRTIACPASNPLSDFGDYKAAQHAVRFLEHEHTKPFFLSVGFILPHASFIMPEANWDLFLNPISYPPIKANDLVDIPKPYCNQEWNKYFKCNPGEMAEYVYNQTEPNPLWPGHIKDMYPTMRRYFNEQVDLYELFDKEKKKMVNWRICPYCKAGEPDK